MNAIVVEEYGDIKNLVHKKVEKPSSPRGHDVLVRYVLRCTLAASQRSRPGLSHAAA